MFNMYKFQTYSLMLNSTKRKTPLKVQIQDGRSLVKGKEVLLAGLVLISF